MELMEVIKLRRSIRSFSDEEVTDKELREVLEAAIWAPSAGNLQPWIFIVVRDRELKEGLYLAAYGQEWVLNAPVVLIACADLSITGSVYGERGRNLYAIQDVAMACQNLMLRAADMGLGTCFIGAFDEGSVKKLLKLREDVRPLGIIPIGRPAERPSPPPRKPLDAVTVWR
ncbi:MAG: nitroreductase [Thermofilum sp. ex4484_15]|nr:MAG: nitroreductase [Thermofilum sp. ex4484_15]